MLFLFIKLYSILCPSNPNTTNDYFNFWVYYLCYFFHSVPIVLVGHKKDLHMDRVVTQEEGRKLANSWKAEFFEASAKQNEVKSKKKL